MKFEILPMQRRAEIEEQERSEAADLGGAGIVAARQRVLHRSGRKCGSYDLYLVRSLWREKKSTSFRSCPDKGWFLLFQLCGPQEAYFDGKWRPVDLVEVKADKLRMRMGIASCPFVSRGAP